MAPLLFGTVSDNWQTQREIRTTRLLKADMLTKEHAPGKPNGQREGRRKQLRTHKLPELSYLSCRKRELTKAKSKKKKSKPFGNTNVMKRILNITRSDVKRRCSTSIRIPTKFDTCFVLVFIVLNVGSVVAPRLVRKRTVTSAWPTTACSSTAPEG